MRFIFSGVDCLMSNNITVIYKEFDQSRAGSLVVEYVCRKVKFAVLYGDDQRVSECRKLVLTSISVDQIDLDKFKNFETTQQYIVKECWVDGVKLL